MKRGKWFRRTLAMLMAAVLVLSAGSALAAEEKVDGSKEATELDGRETTVTLKLPSAESHHKYDIVFVMDSSTSTVNSNIDFSVYAKDLFDALVEKDAELKVGVIKCRGLAFDTIDLCSDDKSGLVEYSADTETVIKDAINFKEADLKELSSGTNMHGGLVMADKWLTADAEVSDDHKYVIMLTDGKTYMWNNADDVPMTYYGQYMGKKNTVYSTPTVGQQTTAYSKSAYQFIDNVNFFERTAADMAALSLDELFEKTGNLYTEDYSKLYESTHADLIGVSKYEYRSGYAYKEGSTAAGTVTTHELTTTKFARAYLLHTKWYEFTPGESFADLNWLQANPYTVQDNGDGTYSYTTTVNPDFYQLHPDSLQKGLYMLGHLWTDMGAKYNTAVINYNDWGSGSGLEIAKSFNNWIIQNNISDYAAQIYFTPLPKDTPAEVVAQTRAEDNAKTAASLVPMFDTIKEDILYMVESGVVTDIIGEKFDIKEPLSKETFRMTLGGEDVECEYTNGQWNFGAADKEGKYPYVVTLSEDKRTITWTLNVPVENLKQVTLSYDLVLKEEVTESGIYDTNESAVLDYVPTEGDPGQYEFEKPNVTYIATTDITVTKVWEDEDDKDGLRPEQIVVNLLADDEAVDEANASDAGKWTVTFSGVPKDKLVNGEFVPIVYSVEEEPVEGYEAEIEEADGVFTITNTHVPETEPVTEPEEIPDETVPLAPPTEEETETETESEEDTTAAPTTTAEEIEENDVPLTPPTITPVTPTQPTRVPMDHGYEEIIDDEVPQALPVTGQVNWPILVLVIAGVVMLGAATIIRRHQKTEG